MNLNRYVKKIYIYFIKIKDVILIVIEILK